MNTLAKPAGPRAIATAAFMVRLMVGGVFLVEGVLKILHPDEFAGGRFAKIGIPAPHVMGPFVAGVETICGAMILLGLLTRLAALPLFIDISVAIISTKIPILIGHGFWRFSLPKVPHYGLLGMVHEARTDFCMWLGLIALMILGPGCCSAGRLLGGKRGPETGSNGAKAKA